MEKQLQHIVFVTPGFAKDESDSKCLPYLQEYFEFFNQYHPSITITIISTEYPAERKTYWWKNIKVIPLGIKSNTIFDQVKLAVRLRKVLVETHQAQSIDIIHSFWLFNCTLISYYLSKLLKIQHICTAMGVDVLNKNKYLYLLPLTKMNVVTVSEFQDQNFKKNHPLLKQKSKPF